MRCYERAWVRGVSWAHGNSLTMITRSVNSLETQRRLALSASLFSGRNSLNTRLRVAGDFNVDKLESTATRTSSLTKAAVPLSLSTQRTSSPAERCNGSFFNGSNHTTPIHHTPMLLHSINANFVLLRAISHKAQRLSPRLARSSLLIIPNRSHAYSVFQPSIAHRCHCQRMELRHQQDGPCTCHCLYQRHTSSILLWPCLHE